MSSPNSESIERLILQHLQGFHPYHPVQPPEVLSRRAGVPPEKVIKLDSNENPYGCSPRVREALGQYGLYHIYPDPAHAGLREALEGYVGLGREHIVVGSGSDELIDLILRLFIEPGDKVINCEPTFEPYRVRTDVCGGEVVVVPRDEGFAVDVDGVERALDKATKVIFVATPNNPSGNTTPLGDILRLVDTGRVVVVDEAYFEFCGETAAPLVARYPNLFVLRTFSKWAGLAGLRVGYGLFPTAIAQRLQDIKLPYNVNAAAQVAGRESLKDLDHIQGTVKAILTERERLYGLLSNFFRENMTDDEQSSVAVDLLRGLSSPVLPSRANFLLCRLGSRANEVKESLERKGIFVRYFNTPRMLDYIRITVGKPEHTDALIEALKEIW
ncbi:MAG: aminotransferase class I/II-fold pyridoxal phosphate-dependent enzyme [Chloroflexota bacterium]|nr:aminotransferase class I/II-fold pyridoxal phosphate-dependent enzyme [Chloroflexota bacterium]